jgi:hypothetical protein
VFRLSLQLLEVALVLVRLDHVASIIVNADHRIMCSAGALRERIGSRVFRTCGSIVRRGVILQH